MLAFAHIQKTAGITVNRILRRSFGVHHCDVQPWHPRTAYYETTYSAKDHQKLVRLYPRLESIAGHRVKPHSDLKSVCPNIRYLTFLREPRARMASHYQYRVQRAGYTQPFEEWLKEEHYHNLQTKHIAGSDDLDLAMRILREECFFVGLIEHFDESLVMLRGKVADPRFDIRYVRENVAPDSSIRERLVNDPASRALMEEANNADLQLYEYVVKELYPAQKREFGATLASEVESFKSTNRLPPLNVNSMLNLVKRNCIYKPMLAYAKRFQS